MSDAAEVAVVWVDVAQSASSPGSALSPAASFAPMSRAEASKALESWAQARAIRLREPPKTPSEAREAPDATVSDQVEKAIETARDALAAADADAVERALARGESLLRGHPELPHAAWLRAEIHRSWAARWSRVVPRDEARARAAWQDADALDGGRLPGVGETTYPARAKERLTLAIQGGFAQRMVVRLDGQEVEQSSSDKGVKLVTVDVAPTEHHLVITLEGLPAFAAWVPVAASRPGAAEATLAIHVGDESACSAAALSRVLRTSAGNVLAEGVACNLWVAAAVSTRTQGIEVARCSGSSCGPFVEWGHALALEVPAVRYAPVPTRPAVSWATWTALGVGVVAASTLTLIAAGVFRSRSGTSESDTRFVAGGVRIE